MSSMWYNSSMQTITVDIMCREDDDSQEDFLTALLTLEAGR